MFLKRLGSDDGSAVVGFALAFGLLAFLFLQTTDLITSVLQQQTATTLAHQLLREGIRLPQSVEIASNIQGELLKRGYEVRVTLTRQRRNTAGVLDVDIQGIHPVFSIHIFGIDEKNE